MKGKQPIQVALVDNYHILRDALAQVLSHCDDLHVAGQADDGRRAIELARRGCDVMILEPLIPFKDGLDIIKEINNIDASIKILVLSLDTTTHNAFRMLRAGARGWLPKTAETHTLIEAVKAVAAGNLFLPAGLKEIFAERYIHPSENDHGAERLSDREYQVMRLLSQGHTNREIATMLFISIKTVDTHRANLLKKLSLRNNADLTRFAVRNGFITL